MKNKYKVVQKKISFKLYIKIKELIKNGFWIQISINHIKSMKIKINEFKCINNFFK